jgi:8-oxo-dGTP pyrophosphatase MutT (NUDIX family)
MMAEMASKPAATIILLRRCKPRGFEVFLMRRPKAMAFLGGMYAFPGGTVRKEDCTPGVIERCYGLSAREARKILGAELAPSRAIGYWVAAIRELYEEAGILLAKRAEGNEALTQSFQAEREALLAKSLTFENLLKRKGLVCDLSQMAYFSRWETPRQLPIRFDTRFYLAPLPEAQTPLPNPSEIEEFVWLSPDRALTLSKREELPMIFPTFASLRTLADFDSLESLFAEYGLREGIRRAE